MSRKKKLEEILELEEMFSSIKKNWEDWVIYSKTKIINLLINLSRKYRLSKSLFFPVVFKKTH